MNTCIHTYVCLYIHTARTHTYVHTHSHTHPHPRTSTHTHTHTHASTHTHTHRNILHHFGSHLGEHMRELPGKLGRCCLQRLSQCLSMQRWVFWCCVCVCVCVCVFVSFRIHAFVYDDDDDNVCVCVCGCVCEYRAQRRHVHGVRDGQVQGLTWTRSMLLMFLQLRVACRFVWPLCVGLCMRYQN